MAGEEWVCEGAQDGAQGGGVSLGRAPSGARLEVAIAGASAARPS